MAREAGANLEDVNDDRVNEINDRSAAGAGSGAYRPRKLRVKGEDITVDSAEKEIELLQKGAAFERNQAQLNEEKRKIREERAQTLNDLQPLLEIDQRLRQDPRKMRMVNAILNDQPLPAEEMETDDPMLQLINEQGRQIKNLTALVTSQVGGVKQEIAGVHRSKALDAEERNIRRKYSKFATDERLDQAREKALETGMSLATAFRDLHFDEIQDSVREQVMEEFEIDGLNMPGASDAPVIEGFGPVTLESITQLAKSDPEKYARFRPDIRRARRALTGKIPLGS